MPATSLVRLLGNLTPAESPGNAGTPETRGFRDILEGQRSREDMEALVSRLQEMGEEIDPALLQWLQQAAPDGNALPLAAIPFMSNGVGAGSGDGDPLAEAGVSLPAGGRGRAPIAEQLMNPAGVAAGNAAGTPGKTVATGVDVATPAQGVARTELSAAFQAELDDAAPDLRAGGLQAASQRAVSDAVLTPASAAARMNQIAPRVGEAGWHQAVAERAMMMVSRDQQSVELRLNPAHLGPMEVRMTLNHDQASVSFIANHAAVRDALEQAIPRLRDMLEQQDIQLVQADVGQHQAGDGHQGQASAGSSARADSGASAADESTLEPDHIEAPGMVRQGLIDTYV